MNKLLEINRELRDIPDPKLSKLYHSLFTTILGSREYFIKKIQVTYGYDRDNAEKTYEYMKYQRAKLALGNFNPESYLFRNNMRCPRHCLGKTLPKTC